MERSRIRLAGYDYSQAGAYFVTVCARRRACLFGDVVGRDVVLSACGRVVSDCWRLLASHFAGLVVDLFVVMPNHLHGIVALSGAGHARPLRAPSLPAVVGSFKSASSRLAGRPLWQRGYYDRIRDEEELLALRQYIVTTLCAGRSTGRTLLAAMPRRAGQARPGQRQAA